MTESTTPASGTVSADYAAAYYHDGLGLPYDYDEPHWARFFGGIADRLIALFAPRTSYDAGCARGFLVRELAARGVAARGGDISDYAISDAPADLAPLLEVRDIADGLPGRFDLVTCIEVLEHMEPDAARTAIGHLCAASDRVLLSSTPSDFHEATHINVRPPASWAQEFALHGFYRRTDVDASFVSPWAVVFERSELTGPQLVHRYEQLLAPVVDEVHVKRQALLEAQRKVEDPEGLALQLAAVTRERDDLRERVGQQGDPLGKLQLVDELIGLRAQLAQVTLSSEYAVEESGREAARLRAVVEGLEAELTALRERVTWAEHEARTKMAEADRLIAEAQTAAGERDAARQTAEDARTRAEQARAASEAQLAERERELGELYSSRSWRIGHGIIGSVSRLRRGR